MDTFYCGNCGAEVESSSKKCPNCGVEFDGGTEEMIEAPVTRPVLTFGDKVSKTVLGLETVANIIKVLSIIAAILVLVAGLINASEVEEGGGLVFLYYGLTALVLGLNAYVSYLIFNWLSHMLNCVYQLTKKKK